MGCQFNQHPDRLQACYGSKDLIEVDAGPLNVALHHLSRLVVHDLACLIALDLEHPFEPDRSVSTGKCSNLQCLIVLNSLHLLVHGRPPRLLMFSFLERSWFISRGEVERGGEHPTHRTRGGTSPTSSLMFRSHSGASS
jgi:hypothetical protein